MRDFRPITRYISQMIQVSFAIYSELLVEIAKFYTPSEFSAPVGGDPSEFREYVWYS